MRVAVLGATGSVGRAILQILDERGFPLSELIPLASPKSAGRQVSFGEQTLEVQEAEGFDFSEVDFVFSATQADVAARLLPRALEAGARVVDKSSAFRMRPDVPLVVPEVNGALLQSSPQLVASPNCVVIPLVIALSPLHQAVSLKRVVLSTYQSVSGAGKKGMDELYAQSRSILMADRPKASVFERPIAFNLIPEIGKSDASGVTEEESKIREETLKIFQPAREDAAVCPLGVCVTAVRVPVFIGHCLCVAVEFREALSLKQAESLLKRAPGLTLFDRGRGGVTPLDVVGYDAVFLSRLRLDSSVSSGVSFWRACDNLRKGAALNAVQIGEEMCGLTPLPKKSQGKPRLC